MVAADPGVSTALRATGGPAHAWCARIQDRVTAERGWVAIASGQIEAAERDFAAADAVLRGNEELAALRESG